MPSIKKLSSEIIGQIAAGEVVERPASAIKELVENSVDAGATSVTVELREGGIRYLRVSDNGKGIPAGQIKLAFERHATSKLSRAEDLFDIHTLGFRGEALASIAAVAKVTLTTRTEGADFGTKAKVEAGEFKDIVQAASPVGTTILVEDLFFNAPVRLKFLKKSALEASMVADYMLRLILSKPEVSFRYVNEGKTVYHSMGDGNITSALFAIYGGDMLKQLQKVHGHMNGLILNGYVGTGELSRGNRHQQSFFVNGRYFRSAALSKALENGCEGRVMIGRFPMCALFLELPYQQVDVNVHPNKLEVRFQNEQGIAQAIALLVKDTMQSESLGAKLTASAAVTPVQNPAVVDNVLPSEQGAPKQSGLGGFVVTKFSEEADEAETSANVKQAKAQPVSFMPKPIVIPAMHAGAQTLHETVMSRTSAEALLKRYTQGASADAPEIRQTQTAREMRAEPIQASSTLQTSPTLHATLTTASEEEQISLVPAPTSETAALRLVGIVFKTYWIFEAGEKLLLVDQHAAHERILYDQLMSRFEGEHISQQLLSPQIVHLTAHDWTLCLELIPILHEAGFEVEPFDESCVSIHAIPTLFGRNEPPRELLLEALDEWQEGRGQVTRERMRKQVAQMACKHAIKGGDQLNEHEVQGFLREMLKSEIMPTCPHGRPIVTEMTRYALEKRFKRVQ